MAAYGPALCLHSPVNESMTTIEIIAALGWLLASTAAAYLWRVSRALGEATRINAALIQERSALFDSLREERDAQNANL